MVTMTGDKEMAYSLGATDFLTKPIDRARLTSLLGRVGSPSSGRALVVDDLEENRSLLRRMLEHEGWGVEEAEDGRVALERMREEAVQLILLDLMMPVMDGFEFLAEVRKVPEWRSIPIIVVTAKQLTDEDRRRLNGSVERVLAKAVLDDGAMLDALREAVGRAPEAT